MSDAAEVADGITRAVLAGDHGAALALIAPDAVDHAPLPGAGPGHAGWRAKWEALAGAEIAVEERIAAGDTAATRYVIRAGGAVVGYALDMIRVRDGVLVEHWALPAPA